jgi:hypothetical protein
MQRERETERKMKREIARKIKERHIFGDRKKDR